MPAEITSSTKTTKPKAPTKVPTVEQPGGVSTMSEFPALQRAMDDPHASLPSDILALQRAAGNRAVSQLLSNKSQPNTVQRSAPPSADAGGRLGGNLEHSITAARGGGQPLDRKVGEQFGSALNTDFGGVTVHIDARADSLNRAISAKAFTLGSDIFFKHGLYHPGSSSGKQLLAHELTHVVQQGAAKNNRVQTKLTVGPAGDKYEQEADRVAQQITSGAGVRAARTSVRGGVQRRIQRVPSWLKKGGAGVGKTFAAPESVYNKLAPDENDTGGGKKGAARRGFQRLGAGMAATVATPFTTAAGVVGAAGVGLAAAGYGIGKAAQYVGGGIAKGAKYVGAKIRDVYMGYQDDVTPMHGDASALNTHVDSKISTQPKAEEYASKLMHKLNEHEHQTRRNFAFLQEDELALSTKEAESNKELTKQNEAPEPGKIASFFGASKAERKAKAQGKKDEASQKLAGTRNDVTEAQQSLNIIAAAAARAGNLYDNLRALGKDGNPSTFRMEMTSVVSAEGVAARERNKVAQKVNAIRKAGRGATLGRGLFKTILAKGLGVGLSIATAGYLNVEKKDRGGEYSSTTRVSGGIQRWKDELKRLTEIRKSTLYGNKKASALYAGLKGMSSLVITPIRNFVGWVALITGLIGTALIATLVAVPVGVVFAGISAFLAGLAVKLTIINAGINALLFIWNAIRRAVVKNQHKVGGLNRELVSTGVTTIAEGGALGLAAAGNALKSHGLGSLHGDKGADQRLFDWNDTPQGLQSVGTANVPLNTTIAATGAFSIGGPIATGITGAALEAKASSKSKAKQEQDYEPHQSNVMRGGMNRGKKKKLQRAVQRKLVIQRAPDESSEGESEEDPRALLPQAIEKANKTQKDMSSAGNTAASIGAKVGSAKTRLASLKSVFKKKGTREGAEEDQATDKNVEATEVSESMLTLTSELFSTTGDDIGAAKEDLVKEVENSGA